MKKQSEDKVYKQCSPHCPYFPQEVSKKNILEVRISPEGVVTRKVLRYCKYDGHLINNWEEICPRYLEKIKKS